MLVGAKVCDLTEDLFSGAAKLTYRAFYDKSMKFGTVIPWNIPISFGRGGNLGHA